MLWPSYPVTCWEDLFREVFDLEFPVVILPNKSIMSRSAITCHDFEELGWGAVAGFQMSGSRTFDIVTMEYYESLKKS